MRFPESSVELVRQLDAQYPEYVPQPGDSLEKIYHSAGQRSVIVALKGWLASAGREPAPARPRGQGRPVK